MNELKPKLFIGFVGTYIAGLYSGVMAQKYIFGPKL